MGLSGSSTTTKPVYADQITGASNSLSKTYNANAPKIQGYADEIGSLIPSLMGKYQNGDPTTNAASGWITNTLGSDSAHNPFLDQQIALTNNNVANATTAKLGTRGLTGGTVMQDILSRNLAQNESGLRYQDYGNQQALKAQAAGLAPSISAARTASIAPLLAVTGTAAGLPMDAATQYAGGIGGLLGQYTNQKTNNPGAFIGSLLQAGATAATAFSDRRLKHNVVKLGELDDGLGVYTYEYNNILPELPRGVMTGVMADEVAQLRPWALGPKIGDYATVDYDQLMEAR